MRGVGEAGAGIERVAALVEHDHLERRTELDRAGIGFECAGQQVEQRGLAGAVGADDADAVAAQHAGGEAAHDGAFAERLVDALGHHDHAPGDVALGGGELGAAGGAAHLLGAGAQFVQVAEAADVALAPGGDAVAQPVFFHHQLAVQLVALLCLLFQRVVAPGFEMGEAAIQPAGGTAVEPDDAAGERFEQAPIMADQHHGGAQGGQFRLQPGDGGQVEVVGRLVQQQDIGRGGEHPGQGGAACFAAGQAGGVLGAVQAEGFQQGADAVGVVARAEAGFSIGEGGFEAGEIRLLRQVAHGGAGLDEALARVLIDQAGGDFQQGGFARAVAADQAQPVAGRDGNIRPAQQRRGAEGEVDVGQEEDRGRHARALSTARCMSPA